MESKPTKKTGVLILYFTSVVCLLWACVIGWVSWLTQYYFLTIIVLVFLVLAIISFFRARKFSSLG